LDGFDGNQIRRRRRKVMDGWKSRGGSISQGLVFWSRGIVFIPLSSS
jgi:hypothetical protein